MTTRRKLGVAFEDNSGFGHPRCDQPVIAWSIFRPVGISRMECALRNQDLPVRAFPIGWNRERWAKGWIGRRIMGRHVGHRLRMRHDRRRRVGVHMAWRRDDLAGRRMVVMMVLLPIAGLGRIRRAQSCRADEGCHGAPASWSRCAACSRHRALHAPPNRQNRQTPESSVAFALWRP